MDDKMKMDRRHLLTAMGALIATPALAQVQAGPGEPGAPINGEGGTIPTSDPEVELMLCIIPTHVKYHLLMMMLLLGMLGAAAVASGGFALKIGASLALAGAAAGEVLGWAVIGAVLAGLGGGAAVLGKVMYDLYQDPPRKDWDQPVTPIQWETVDPVSPVAGVDSRVLDHARDLTQSLLDAAAVMVAFLETREKYIGALKAGDDYYSTSLKAALSELWPQLVWHYEDVQNRADVFAQDIPYWREILNVTDPNEVFSDEFVFPEAKAAYEKSLYAIPLDYASRLQICTYEDMTAQLQQVPSTVILRQVEDTNKLCQRVFPSLMQELKRTCPDG